MHAIGDDAGREEGRQTLVFTRAAVAYHNVNGYGHNFEQVLTGKDPGNPPDAGTFRVVMKVRKEAPAAFIAYKRSVAFLRGNAKEASLLVP